MTFLLEIANGCIIHNLGLYETAQIRYEWYYEGFSFLRFHDSKDAKKWIDRSNGLFGDIIDD